VGKYLWDNGYPWNCGLHPELKKDLLAVNLDDIKKRIKLGKAGIIIVDGIVGEGKTTLAVHIMQYLVAESFAKEHEIPLKDYVFMGKAEFTKGLSEAYYHKRPGMVYDEAGDYNSKGHATKLNRELDRVFEVFRAFKVIIVMTLPSFLKLPGDLFDKGIPRMLIHCHDREESHGHFSVYNLVEMNYMRLYAVKHPATKNQCYSVIKPCFRGVWRNLPTHRSNELDRIGRSGKIAINDQLAIKSNGWYSFSDISKEVGRTQRTISDKLKLLGIKPVSVVKKVKYFKQEDYEKVKKVFQSQPKQ
jgi:hypothetical protein